MAQTKKKTAASPSKIKVQYYRSAIGFTITRSSWLRGWGSES